jgi:hypothetical protein
LIEPSVLQNNNEKSIEPNVFFIEPKAFEPTDEIAFKSKPIVIENNRKDNAEEILNNNSYYYKDKPLGENK